MLYDFYQIWTRVFFRSSKRCQKPVDNVFGLLYLNKLNRSTMRHYILLFLLLFFQCDTKRESGTAFTISFTKELSDQAQNGRLLLMLSQSDKTEPRFQINDGLKAQLIFGVDVEGMKPGEQIQITNETFGFPIRRVGEIPKGVYYVQALINRYETFNLKTGHTVKLPPTKGKDNNGTASPATFTAGHPKSPSTLPNQLK